MDRYDPYTDKFIRDTIDRQAAIDAVRATLLAWSYMPEWRDNKIIEAVKRLPPASCSEFPNNSDTISRQAAIDGKICIQRANGVEIYDDYAVPVEYLKQLPPAQPKTGRWIPDRSGAYCCSECMEPCAGYVMMRPRDKFCKMCGSRNEVTT